jgi:hypothetical protein
VTWGNKSSGGETRTLNLRINSPSTHVLSGSASSWLVPFAQVRGYPWSGLVLAHPGLSRTDWQQDRQQELAAECWSQQSLRFGRDRCRSRPAHALTELRDVGRDLQVVRLAPDVRDQLAAMTPSPAPRELVSWLGRSATVST